MQQRNLGNKMDKYSELEKDWFLENIKQKESMQKWMLIEHLKDKKDNGRQWVIYLRSLWEWTAEQSTGRLNKGINAAKIYKE